MTLLLLAADENLRDTDWEVSTCESGSAQVLVAPEAARAAIPVSKQRSEARQRDDIAGTTGGSFSRPHASVTCAGRTTTQSAALLRASARRTHRAG